jgi:hypothetical protein
MGICGEEAGADAERRRRFQEVVSVKFRNKDCGEPRHKFFRQNLVAKEQATHLEMMCLRSPDTYLYKVFAVQILRYGRFTFSRNFVLEDRTNRSYLRIALLATLKHQDN